MTRILRLPLCFASLRRLAAEPAGDRAGSWWLRRAVAGSEVNGNPFAALAAIQTLPGKP